MKFTLRNIILKLFKLNKKENLYLLTRIRNSSIAKEYDGFGELKSALYRKKKKPPP